VDGRIHELLHRNLQEVFGEGDAAPRRHRRTLYRRLRALRAARQVRRVCRPSTNSPEIFARRTPTLFTRPTANLRLSTMPVA